MPAKAGISVGTLLAEMPAFAGMTMKARMDHATLLKRLRFRAWHRGTKEADLLVGGYFDARHAGWDANAVAWFEALLEEQDVDIMAWAIGREAFPERLAGPLAEDMLRLDYIPVAR